MKCRQKRQARMFMHSELEPFIGIEYLGFFPHPSYYMIENTYSTLFHMHVENFHQAEWKLWALYRIK